MEDKVLVGLISSLFGMGTAVFGFLKVRRENLKKQEQTSDRVTYVEELIALYRDQHKEVAEQLEISVAHAGDCERMLNNLTNKIGKMQIQRDEEGNHISKLRQEIADLKNKIGE